MVTKVLVVDDEPLLRTLFLFNFEDRIKANELQFYFANNGVEALEVLENVKDIGIVITDIKMPEMNGLELLKNLADQDRIYRSAVVTAYGDIKNIREAMSYGASDFITKPIDFRDLDKTLSKIISQYNTYLKANQAKLAEVSLKKELVIAQEVQDMLSPKDFNPFPNFSDVFDIFGKIYPSEDVSGAFFDFIPIDDHRLALVIGDSSGKSIPASLFMTMTLTMIRGFINTNTPLKECLQRTNKLLSQHNKTNLSVTVFLSTLDILNGKLSFCNAGHKPALIVSSDGTIKTLEEGLGIPLGSGDASYQESVLTLKKGDTLFFYTKGVTEAKNKNNELFGEDRLKAYLKTCSHESLNKILYGLKEEIDTFSADYPQVGDIAILLLRYRGN